MKLLLSSTLFLFSLAAFGQAPSPRPLQGTTVTPKETTSSLKLELNRSRYASAVTAFQEKQQQAFYQQLKPVLDQLDSEEQTIEQQVRTDNGWDASYQFDNVTGQWKKVEKDISKTDKK
ncbi:MAG: hypothetical protein KGL39_57745 [Patescibacteria group bacterium]|nr:hypothetical protein [Patescibacteria group bacterium]